MERERLQEAQLKMEQLRAEAAAKRESLRQLEEQELQRQALQGNRHWLLAQDDDDDEWTDEEDQSARGAAKQHAPGKEDDNDDDWSEDGEAGAADSSDEEAAQTLPPKQAAGEDAEVCSFSLSWVKSHEPAHPPNFGCGARCRGSLGGVWSLHWKRTSVQVKTGLLHGRQGCSSDSLCYEHSREVSLLRCMQFRVVTFLLRTFGNLGL